ncbi:MAG: signal peptidase I [Myxococcales bacterium]|nr:signal peptidase I [Myxococcales bacterium]
MTGFFDTWKARRELKRTRGEARHALAECRRILKKRGYLVPEAATQELKIHADAVEAALGTPDVERLREAVVSLDDRMTKHLSFARKSAIREYAESIGVAVGIAIFLRAFVVEAFQIPSGSMIPTLQVGDHIFVSKFSYGITIPFTDRKLVDFGPPKRGDVIVFKVPGGPVHRLHQAVSWVSLETRWKSGTTRSSSTASLSLVSTNPTAASPNKSDPSSRESVSSGLSTWANGRTTPSFTAGATRSIPSRFPKARFS